MPVESGKTEPTKEKRDQQSVISELADLTGEIAGKAARMLDRELDQETDTKRAKELAAILKDMSQLYGQLRGGGQQTLAVRFLGDAGEYGA